MHCMYAYLRPHTLQNVNRNVSTNNICIYVESVMCLAMTCILVCLCMVFLKGVCVCVCKQVLAHRGGHWTTLQCVCRTLWDQGCTITLLVDRGTSMEPPIPLTLDQLNTVLTPLFELATDLVMNMMETMQVSLYHFTLTCF